MSDRDAVEPWNDLYLRAALSGSRPGSSLDARSSPDIIPCTAAVDPSSFATAADYACLHPAAGLRHRQTGFVYVRAANAAASAVAPKAEATLFKTSSSLVCFPGDDDWTMLFDTGRNNRIALQPRPLPAGAVAVTAAPFVYAQDDEEIPCFVSWLSTGNHPQPSPPPRLYNLGGVARFLAASPNYVCHNVALAPPAMGQARFNRPFRVGDTAARVVFGLELINCAGFRVSMTAARALPDGRRVQLEPTVVPGDDAFRCRMGPFAVPAHWGTDFDVAYDPSGSAPVDFSINLICEYVIDERSEPSLWPVARPLSGLIGTDKAGLKAFRSVVVGSVGVMRSSS